MKSRRVANTFVEGRPWWVRNQHDLATTAEHVVPNDLTPTDLEDQQETTLGSDELDEAHTFQAKKLILEYDDIARTAYEELAEKDPKFAETFLQKLLDNPQSDVEQLKADSIQDNLPFDTAELNDAYLSLAYLGGDAQAEFKQLVGLLRDRMDTKSTVEKIKNKYEKKSQTKISLHEKPDVKRIIDDLNYQFQISSIRLSDSRYELLAPNLDTIGIFRPDQLDDVLTAKRMEASKRPDEQPFTRRQEFAYRGRRVRVKNDFYIYDGIRFDTAQAAREYIDSISGGK